MPVIFIRTGQSQSVWRVGLYGDMWILIPLADKSITSSCQDDPVVYFGVKVVFVHISPCHNCQRETYRGHLSIKFWYKTIVPQKRWRRLRSLSTGHQIQSTLDSMLRRQTVCFRNPAPLPILHCISCNLLPSPQASRLPAFRVVIILTSQLLTQNSIVGWYKDAGLDVTLLSPHSDTYATTPAKRVASGEADLAIAPAETVVSSHTQPAGSTKPKLTVCQWTLIHYCFTLKLVYWKAYNSEEHSMITICCCQIWTAATFISCHVA